MDDCSACGEQVAPTDAFCKSCGAALSPPEPPSEGSGSARTAPPASDVGVSQTGDDGAPDDSRSARPKSRKRAAIVGALVVLVAAGAVVATLTILSSDEKSGPSKNGRYITALRKKGLLDEFSSRPNAIASGKRVCRSLKNGADQQGSSADKVGVATYCHAFLTGFHVLETIRVVGVFELKDSSPSEILPSIEVANGTCNGMGGFNDIREGTTVLVKNGDGKLLTQTALTRGIGINNTSCLFSFSFMVTEGEDQYVVSVSHRGDITHSFSDLKQGLGLTLGS